MFFNDGAWYLSRSGPVQVTNVLNHMYATGQIGPTVAVFVTPGEPDHDVKVLLRATTICWRSAAWNTIRLMHAMASFSFKNYCPSQNLLAARRSLKIPPRLVCGISSGGIAAFSAAWFILANAREFKSLRVFYGYLGQAPLPFYDSAHTAKTNSRVFTKWRQ